MNNETRKTRRDFMSGAVAAAGGLTILGATARGQGKTFKVGLIGCGGRGNGALAQDIQAGKHLGLNMQVVATCDFFKGKAERTGKKYGVPKARCFGGANGYKKFLDTDVEVVCIATSPNFRPVHFEAAVKAGKHVFMEKPVAVDPPGGRRIIAAGELAKKKGLAVVAGTQRRHSSGYRRRAFEILNGIHGTIAGGAIWWCGGKLWYHTQRQGEADASYLVRNWVSFAEMSGDHIVEQHVHNIDIANWFIGHPPRAAAGFGGRARRKTGNQFDFFSIDFDYGDGCHIHSMCRQVDGCWGRVGEHFTFNRARAVQKDLQVPKFPEHGGAYVQEHIDLLDSIVKGQPLNEARNVAEATLAAVMGRIAAYTGQLVTWDELMKPEVSRGRRKEKSRWYDFTLKPTAEDFEAGAVVAPEDDVAPIPGRF